MIYRVTVSDSAKHDIFACMDYLTAYSDRFAEQKSLEIARFIFNDLPKNPTLWSYFFITGAPYRAYLFKIGKKSAYWLVYTLDDETKTIEVLRFWHASQNPIIFEIESL